MPLLEADAFAVTVSSRRRRQVIENFGASGCWTMDPLGAAWGEADKKTIPTAPPT